MKSNIQNIRTKVDKRQIIQYLILRNRVLYNKVINPTNETEELIRNAKLKSKEVNKLLELIRNDKIDNEIRKMHQYIHKQNDYLKLQKQLPPEAVKGLISALYDVKNGRYTVVSNQDADHESKDDNNVKEEIKWNVNVKINVNMD